MELHKGSKNIFLQQKLVSKKLNVLADRRKIPLIKARFAAPKTINPQMKLQDFNVKEIVVLS